MFCLSLFLLATLSIMLFALIFLLLWLFYSKLKMAYPFCWTRLDAIPHIAWQCPHVWHFEIETHNLKLSHHQLHCSLKDLGLCNVQCLATHYLEFHPWLCVYCSWNFLEVSFIMLEISAIMLALCFILFSPYCA